MDGLVPGIVLAVYALALWILMIFIWRRGYREWKTNRANRLEKFAARVMDRREKTIWASNPEERSKVEQYVYFEYNGRQNEFPVDPSTYAEARIGREGTLYTRGGRFDTFEPKSEGEQAEDIYRRVVGR